MCKHLEISRAAYYKWQHREIPLQEKENIELANLIKEYDEVIDLYHLGFPKNWKTLLEKKDNNSDIVNS